MKLTGLGKLVILILAVGLALGGYRAWQQMSGGKAGRPGVSLPKFGGNSGGNTNSGGGNSDGGGSGGGGSGGGGSGGGASGNEIEFVITAAKKDWVQDQINRFNESNGGQYTIKAVPMPSREAMHSILSGRVKPVLWSPGSPVWPTRLAQAWREKHPDTILDLNDPNGYRVFLRSPLVFLTTKKKAQFLRPLLGGPQPWLSLRRLSMNPQSTPWGSFRFSHADPLTSSSGLLTMGLVLADYAQRTGQAGAYNRVATDPKFLQYLRELERSLVYDAPAEAGTTKLTKAFIEDPTRYDVITAYESAALDAAPKNPNLAVIYPNVTAVSEHAASLLSGNWVTPEQKAGAQKFLQFLGSREALQSGIKYRFRPATAGGDLSLAPDLQRFSGQGFQQTFSTIELPPYEAINAAIFQWRLKIVKKPIT